MSDDPETPETPPNARFIDIGGGTIAELMANEVQFFYDPTTMAARANFNGMPYLNINNTYRALVETTDILKVDFTDKFTKCYAAGLGAAVLDPVTGMDLGGVSVAGVMILMKVAYDIEVNAREADRLAKIAAAEAAATAAALYAAAVDSPNANGTICDYSATSVDGNLTVAFNDVSIGGNGLSLASYSWMFGDFVGLSAEVSPTYTFSKAGDYTVTLVVTDSVGQTTRTAQAITVPMPAQTPGP